MTAEHDALRDLIAPVALGAAEPHEIARVEAHAAECAVCREELTSLRATADALAVAVPQLDPPPDLKASLMATVRAEAPARAEAAGVTGAPVRTAGTPASGRRSWLPARLMRPWPAMAALAIVAALVLSVVAIQSNSGGPGPAGGSTAIAVTGTADAPGVTGRIVYVPDEDTAVVTLSRLPQLDPGDAYQLWIIREGQDPQSAGLFEPTGPAEAQTVATGLAGADALAVTAQPRTSRTTPQGPILVEAALQNG